MIIKNIKRHDRHCDGNVGSSVKSWLTSVVEQALILLVDNFPDAMAANNEWYT